jgi:hypothetical protein
VDNENRSLEQIYRSAVSGLYARIRSNYDYIYSKFGDEGIKLIADMSREYGLTVAARARNKLSSADLMSVANYLMRIFETVSQGKNTVFLAEVSPARVVIRVDECPLHFDNQEMCLAHTTMEKTVVEGLNASLGYRIGRSISHGDAYCEHIVEVKSADDSGGH